MSADGYLPPGCSYNDIPGWNDVERDFEFFCESCEHEWTEVDYTVDSRGGSTVESNCPLCGVLHTIEDDPDNDDGRDYEDYRDYMEGSYP